MVERYLFRFVFLISEIRNFVGDVRKNTYRVTGKHALNESRHL